MLLSPSYLAPLCDSVFSFFCFLFGGHSHNDTQDVIMHVIPIAGSDPTSLCFVCFGLVVVVCFLFAWFFFVSGCVFFGFLLGHLAGLRTGPLPVLLWLSTSRQPHMIITIFIFLLRLNVCNDLAEAMKALDGKKNGSAPVAFRRVALETSEWTSRDSNHHQQSVSAGKTNAIPTEPSGRLCNIKCYK